MLQKHKCERIVIPELDGFFQAFYWKISTIFKVCLQKKIFVL